MKTGSPNGRKENSRGGFNIRSDYFCQKIQGPQDKIKKGRVFDNNGLGFRVKV
jgi:hypothetical protein